MCTWQASNNDPSNYTPATNIREFDGDFGFWLRPDSARAVAGIWGVFKGMESLSLTLQFSITLSVFQIDSYIDKCLKRPEFHTQKIKQ